MQMTRRWMAVAALLGVAALGTAPVAVAASGDTVTPVDRGVTGRVAGRQMAVAGLVTGEDGAPLAGVQLEVFRYDTGLVATGVTGADGTFAVAVPPSAESLYWVRGWAKGYETAQAVAVAGRQAPWVSLVLKELTGAVSGEVTGPDGAPAAGARVALLRAGYGVAAEGTTDLAGRFTFDGVAAGSGYSVRVQALGHTPAVAALEAVPAGGTAVSRVTLAVQAGSVSGKVVDEATGRPVAGARVAVERADLGVVATVATAADGGFAAAVPAATGAVGGGTAATGAGAVGGGTAATGAGAVGGGTAATGAGAAFGVTVTAPGYQPLRVDGVLLNNLGRATLTGERQLKLAPLTAAVSGRVLDSDGQPVAGLTVLLEQEGIGVVATAETAADGAFRWEAVAAGHRYRVRVLAAEMVHRHGWKQWAPATGDWFTPTGGRVTALSLALTESRPHDYGNGQIRGFVTLPGGLPVTGATVELLRPGMATDLAAASTTTAADGSYRFEQVDANLVPELRREPGTPYVLRVTADGYHTALTPAVDVTTGQERLVDIALAPRRAPLVVRVISQDGAPLDLAEVLLHPARGGEPLTAQTAGGLARLSAPTGTAYWLQIVRPGYRAAVVSTVSLSPGQETAVDVVLQAESSMVAGRVADGAQRSLAGAAVTATLPDGTVLQVLTDAGGGYELSGLPAGVPVTIQARLDGYTTAASAQTLTLSPGKQTSADLTLRAAAGRVTGVVVDGAGRPAAGVPVQLWRSGQGAVDQVTTGADGRFAFAGVPADPDRAYAVRVVAPGAGVRQAGFRTPIPLFKLEPGKTVTLQLVMTAIE
jgi:5-hydroxyisourate hydrolase-like protein (transthyretin family)